MPLTRLNAAKKLIFAIKGYRHKYYQRVTALADEYYKLISGDGVDTLLRQYVKRETEADFKQRVDITEAITPAVSEKIMSPFEKVGRVDNVLKRMRFDQDENLEKRNELIETLETFHGDEDLDSYMETSYINNSFIDPNMFIVVDFEEFDARLNEKPQPFPVEIPSYDALDFKYKNNKLKWLVVRRPITITNVDSDGKEEHIETYRYAIYMDNEIIELKPLRLAKQDGETAKSTLQVDEDGELITDDQIVLKAENEKSSMVYQISILEPMAGMVQAIRIGYKKDLVTKNKTFISPLHSALPRMRKTLKSVSELDLTATLHAHPHKYQFMEKCKGPSPTTPCQDGMLSKNQTCPKCNGSGWDVPTSAQDMIIMPLPKHPDDMLDLSKLSYFESPPIDLLEWQEAYTDKLEQECIKDVFVSETFNRKKGAATATEVVIDMQSVYDTLFRFAKQYSKVWVKMVRLSAIFTSNSDGLSVSHKFPKDFKLKTVEQLISDLKAAHDANAPDFVKTEIERDIARGLFLDNPRMLKIFDVKESHRPFKGKDKEEIMFIVSSEMADKYDRVLWANFEAIFRKLEQDQLEKEIDFYDLGYKKRTELLDEVVKSFIDSTTPAPPRPFVELDE